MARKTPTALPMRGNQQGAVRIRPDVLHALLAWATTEETRAYCGINVETARGPNGTRLLAVATDGRRLLVLSVPHGGEPINGFVDRKTADTALRVAKATKAEDVELHPSAEGGKQFPPWRQIVPRDNPRENPGFVGLDPRLLADTALVQKTMAADKIGFMVGGPLDPVVMRAHDYDSSWLGLIMPRRLEPHTKGGGSIDAVPGAEEEVRAAE